MRFLIDESTGASVAHYLRSQGHDVVEVAEIAPRIPDSDILEWAEREARILITNDKDFGELVFRSERTHYGILLLRLRNISPANKVAVVSAALNQYSDRMSGNFLVATETGTIRIHEQRPHLDDQNTLEG